MASEGGRVAHAGDDQGDDEEQRQRYQELLQELRVIQPGVQVLFAFLLTVPFSSRFEELDRTGRSLFVVTLVLTALSAFAFVAPTAFHRVAERAERAARIRIGIRFQVAGLVLLATAMVVAVFVVVRFMFGTAWGVGIAAPAGVAALTAWYVVPASHRR